MSPLRSINHVLDVSGGFQDLKIDLDFVAVNKAGLLRTYGSRRRFVERNGLINYSLGNHSLRTDLSLFLSLNRVFDPFAAY